MAGSFPDYPSRKIPYDSDGSIVAVRYPSHTSGTEEWLEWGDSDKADLNNIDEGPITWNPYSIEGNACVDVLAGYFCETVFVFPEHRDLYGWWTTFSALNIYSENQLIVIAVSPDSTNGYDGTWTQIASFQIGDFGSQRYWGGLFNPRIGDHRNNLREIDQSGIRAVRITAGWESGFISPCDWRSAHFWGTISAGETPDRLLFIDNDTGLEYTAPQDWGDTPRGLTQDKEIKIKNNSATYSASAITLSFTSEYLASDTWHTIMETGGSFDTTLLIGPIAAGASYPAAANVITIRNAVPAAANIGLYECRLEASAPTWT